MNFRSFIFAIITALIFTTSIWILILFNIDPYKADWLSKISFFLSLLIMITCILTLFGYYIRKKILNNELIYSILPVSFRQGILGALIIVGIIILSCINVLNWWIAGIWLLIILLIELFFKTRKI